MSETASAGRVESTPVRGWKLGEAKAGSSEVVRLAAADSLHEILSNSPLNRLEFDAAGVRSPVREIDL